MRIWVALFGVMMLTGGQGTVSAQTPRVPWVGGFYAQGGFIVAHSSRVRHLVRAHPTGLELNLQRQTTGHAPWHAWYGYPKIGLALVYYDYHNPVLGRSYAASFYLNKTYWRTTRQELNFRLGTGIGWFTQVFSQESNHKNALVSSRCNAMLQARVEYDWALSPRVGLLVGVGLNHFSNGATAKPNLGINIPTVVLGLNFHQQRSFRPLDVPPPPEPEDIGQNFLYLSTSLGIKRLNEIDLKTYLVNSVSVVGGRRVNRKSNLLLGLEGFYDRSLRAEQRDTARQDVPLVDVKKAGVFLGHELLFGRLALVTHLGVYVYNPYKSNNFYYERVGLKYHFTNRLFGAVDLKVHRGAADVLEWKAGVKL
ncbi:acyloxyacyl hydrolase [Hymenobacter sp. BT730]|uniref:acyloxyacyl hydrolase n=1 Tax=Hymenobacter sp. BT730 TaxID=3063332 RepID=UPI0026DEE2E3|nr:acyloxyacyl hydrolase [Hymenobacter sp. BT730]